MRKHNIVYLILLLLINYSSPIHAQTNTPSNNLNQNFLIANGEFTSEVSYFTNNYLETGIEYTINNNFKCYNEIVHLSSSSFKLIQRWELKNSFFEQKIDGNTYTDYRLEIEILKDDIKIGSITEINEKNLFSIEYIIDKKNGIITDIENDYNGNSFRLRADFDTGIYIYNTIIQSGINNNNPIFHPNSYNWFIGYEGVDHHVFGDNLMEVVSNTTQDSMSVWSLKTLLEYVDYTTGEIVGDFTIKQNVEKSSGFILESSYEIDMTDSSIIEYKYKITELKNIIDNGPPQIITPPHLVLPPSTFSWTLEFEVIENHISSYILTRNGNIVDELTPNQYVGDRWAYSPQYKFNVLLEYGNNTFILTINDTIGFSTTALVWIFVPLPGSLDSNSLNFPLTYQTIIAFFFLRKINQKYMKNKTPSKYFTF